jgi:hypothetical protein
VSAKRPSNEATDETKSPRWDLYLEHARQAWADQQASSDEFDKSLLTFASGTLGLSLAFIKDIVPLKEAVALRMLFGSWVAFTLCIVVTIFSFPLSRQAQKRHVEYLYEYYINGTGKKDKESIWTKAVHVCAVLGGLFFLAGLVATVIFAWKNIARLHQ